MGYGNDFTTTTTTTTPTPTPKIMILFIIQLIYLLPTLSSPKPLRHRLPSHNIFISFSLIYLFPLYCYQTTDFHLPDGRTASPFYPPFSPRCFWLVVVCVWLLSLTGGGCRISSHPRRRISSHNKFVASFQSMRIHPQYALIPARSFVVVIV